jgi:tape measure domain-containing protein
MADKTEALVLQMSADVRRMERALQRASQATDKSLATVEKRFDKMNAHVRRSGDEMARDLRASVAAIGVTLALRQVTDYGDAWTEASNKLRAAGVTQANLAGTMSDLVALAKATRSEFGGTVDLYAKLTRAGQQLNLTQDEVRRITETTLQAFVAGGAAASEQAAAITQLSQALGSGVLQGDELKSIRENAPLLAQAIADEFKTTIGGLKDLGAEGALTADRVAKAILNADGISDAFGRTISTVAQAMTNLRTEFTRYIAESRVAQTVFQALGGFIQFVTDNIDLLADAALVAASVIGGALAVAAIGRFISALVTLRRDVAAAESAMKALRLAMTFLGGPVGAVILGIAAALGSLAFSAAEGATAMESANGAIDKLSTAQQSLVADTDALAAAQDRLTAAINANSAAAQSAAITDIEAIGKRIAANQALAETERVRLNEARAKRQREFRDLTPVTDKELQGVSLPILGLIGDKTDSIETLVARMQDTFKRSGLDSSIEGIRSRISSESKKGPLSEQFRSFFWILKRYDKFTNDIQAIDNALAGVDQIQAINVDGFKPLAMPSLEKAGGSGGGSTSSDVRGYRTEIEKLTDALEALRKAKQADIDLNNSTVFAFDSFAQFGDKTNETAFNSELARRQDAVEQTSKALAANDVARSRETVDAILNYARSGAVADAFAQIPSVADVLIGSDPQLLRAELKKLAQEGVDAIATGDAKIEADRRKALAEVEAVRRDAMAAGIDATAWYYEKLKEIEQEYRDSKAEQFDKQFPISGIPTVADQVANSGEKLAEDIRQSWVRDGLVPSQAMLDLQDKMRDAVKNAMRDGIRTGDWGDAFASILADAVTTGLDGALNRVGDWLADLLFRQDGGLLNDLASAATSAFGGSPTGRPTGGGASAGGAYRVNDRAGGKEFLFMGSNAGQVLRAADIAGMLGGGKEAGPTTLYAPLIVQGSIDAVTWPAVQQHLKQRDQALLSAMPTVVRATRIDDRIQKRKY